MANLQHKEYHYVHTDHLVQKKSLYLFQRKLVHKETLIPKGWVNFRKVLLTKEGDFFEIKNEANKVKCQKKSKTLRWELENVYVDVNAYLNYHEADFEYFGSKPDEDWPDELYHYWAYSLNKRYFEVIMKEKGNSMEFVRFEYSEPHRRIQMYDIEWFYSDDIPFSIFEKPSGCFWMLQFPFINYYFQFKMIWLHS